MRILVPQSGFEPQLRQWKHQDLSTGLPGNFLWVSFFKMCKELISKPDSFISASSIPYPFVWCRQVRASLGKGYTHVTCSRIRMLLSLKEGRSERLQTPTPAWAGADSSRWSSCEERRACSPEWGPSKPSGWDSAGEGAERGARKPEGLLVCVPTAGGNGVDFKPSSRGMGSLGSSSYRDDGDIHEVADHGPTESGHLVSTHSLLSFGWSSGLISSCGKTLAFWYAWKSVGSWSNCGAARVLPPLPSPASEAAHLAAFCLGRWNGGSRWVSYF